MSETLNEYRSTQNDLRHLGVWDKIRLIFKESSMNDEVKRQNELKKHTDLKNLEKSLISFVEQVIENLVEKESKYVIFDLDNKYLAVQDKVLKGDKGFITFYDIEYLDTGVSNRVLNRKTRVKLTRR